jgi:hypothetical protein
MKKAIVSGPELSKGRSDRVRYPGAGAEPLERSLTLVAPRRLELYQRVSSRGTVQVRGKFDLGKTPKRVAYDLSVTDPIWERMVRRHGDRDLDQTDAGFVITISLGEPLESRCYKIIAAIILLPEEFGDLVA